jgi:hypothetical protein
MTGFMPTRFLFLILLVLSCGSSPQQETIPAPTASISDLTYAEIYSQTPNMYTPEKLEKYSGELKGTRVHWTGEVLATGPDGRVHVAMDGHRTPNVDFVLDSDETDKLDPGTTVSFTGTIENITSIQTYPPMPNMHVSLVDVSLNPPL